MSSAIEHPGTHHGDHRGERHGAGVVDTAHHGHHGIPEVVVDGISSLDEPSVEWGWHRHSRGFGWMIGLPFAAFLLLMTIGNHVGNTENYFLIGAAVCVVLAMLLTLRPRKDTTARKNRVYQVPEGHYTTTTF